jgi:hypothetical protein
VNNYLDTTDDLERNGKDERVQKGGDGLEDGDVLGKRAVPNETKDEGADENVEHEDENLGDHLGARLGLGNLLKHLLHTDIFF